jgi:tetraacyldisaccharide 4'-kinase
LIRSLSSAYSAAAAWRRRWYAADPARRRWLQRPVISVGSLRVGGSGKTPIVAHIARLLVDQGERPAILTRGYARRIVSPGVTVVSDGATIHADLDESGDEPLQLARELKNVAVLVGADRYLSGRLAEMRLGSTVHILDDGFQHFELARDVDLLLVAEEDLTDAPLPAGRLRESIAAASNADAALVLAGYATAADRIGRAFGVSPVFRVTRSLGVPRMIAGPRDSVVVPSGSRVFTVAGIARPERFFADVTSVGWEIVGSMTFRDHHRFTPRDVERIRAAARSCSAAIVLTTEKDAVRLDACDLGGLPVASVPLHVGVEPPETFRDWLMDRLHAAAGITADRLQSGIASPAVRT